MGNKTFVAAEMRTDPIGVQDLNDRLASDGRF